MDPASVEREVLPNGLTVLVRRDDTAPVVAIVTHVKAGYFDETDDVVGIAHVLEHMYFKGTPTRGVGVIAKETKASGGYLNASTIYDHTVYYTVLPSSGLVAGLEIQADAYANSVIDAGELARELEVIIQEAKRKSDNPSAVTTETLFELLHDRHRMRRWRIGREAGLRRLTRDDLVRFYRNFYRPSSTILSIVGDIDVAETMRHVRRLYGGLEAAPVDRQSGPDETGADRFRYRELSGDIAQAQMVFGWRTPPTMHEDTPLLDLAAGILGSGRASRLYRAVRERQLAASVSAYNYTPTDVGVFVVHAEMPAASVVPACAARSGIRCARCATTGVLPQEVDARAARVRFAVAASPREHGRAGHAPRGMGGVRRLAARATGTYERVDERDARRRLREAVRRYLTPDRAGWVVYRPTSAIAVCRRCRTRRSELLDVRALSRHCRRRRTSATRRHRRALARVSPRARGRRGAVYRTRHRRSGARPAADRRADHARRRLHVRRRGHRAAQRSAGSSTLLARTSLKGTERRSATAIAEESELLGAVIGTSATTDGVGWTISVPAPRAVAAIDLLADVVQRPTFPDDGARDRAHRRAGERRAAARRHVSLSGAARACRRRTARIPYARSVLGTEETLGAIDARRGARLASRSRAAGAGRDRGRR